MQTGDGATGDERRAGFEKRMRNQVEAIVSSVVGLGRARVELTADFDYNKVTQTSDKFDPEGRVLRSSQSREESSATAGPSDGQVTVNNELPGNQAQGGGATAKDQSKKSEETNNYEISRTTKTEVTEAGRVNRISVAVLVDGSYAKNDKGELVYQERGKDQLDRIAALVRSAIGFDQKRGDQVEIVNLKFAEGPTIASRPTSGQTFCHRPTDGAPAPLHCRKIALLERTLNPYGGASLAMGATRGRSTRVRVRLRLLDGRGATGAGAGGGGGGTVSSASRAGTGTEVTGQMAAASASAASSKHPGCRRSLRARRMPRPTPDGVGGARGPRLADCVGAAQAPTSSSRRARDGPRAR